jgi:hypothetical protein
LITVESLDNVEQLLSNVKEVPQMRRHITLEHWLTVLTFLLVLFLIATPLAACAPQPWKQDPDVQTAKRDCTQPAEGERYACIERHAVDSLNPDVCRLAGRWIDDMCLQAVYQAADDPTICDRLYLKGVRPTCRAYYRRPAVDFTTSTLIEVDGEAGRQTIRYRIMVVHQGNRPVEDLTAWLVLPKAKGLPARVLLQTEALPIVVVKPNYGRVYKGEIVWETERSKEESGALLDQAQIRLAWTLEGERQEKLFPPLTEKGPDWGRSVP